jgi:hypothetical protein
MTATQERAARIVRELQTIHAETAHARDYADSGPDHTHRPDRTAEQAAYDDLDEAERIAERIAEAAARIAGGEYRPAYNGWKNRETWNASLWINNDQGLSESAAEILREACAGSDYDTRGTYTVEQDRRYQLTVAGDALKDWYDETFAPSESGSERAGPASDVWTYALACVDWLAVAEGIAEGMEPDPTTAEGRKAIRS